jgi:hypothetical protein
MPLSEFAKRNRRHEHTGHGRRDQLTAGERTRILRMLRDEGGRLADEESQVHIGVVPAPKDYDFDFDDEGAAPAPPPAPARADVPAKPALVVGLAQARNKRQTGGPSPVQPARGKPATAPPPIPRAAPPPVPGRAPPPPARGGGGRRPPNPFEDKTRAMQDAELIAAVRGAPGPGQAPTSLFDEPTRMGEIDENLLAATQREDLITDREQAADYPPKFLSAATELSPPLFGQGGVDPHAFEIDSDAEKTRMANVDSIQRRTPRKPPPPSRNPQGGHEERTRAVDIRNDPSISDIDWDID